MAASRPYSVAVIGGGIVGTSVARSLLLRYPSLSVVLLEKEDALAQHQSTRNSGVIHAGIYYAPGSARAKMCVEGSRALYEYCDRRGVPYKRNGKLILAPDPASERERLYALYDRGLANGVPGLELIDRARIREICPAAAASPGAEAIWSPNTGIVSYPSVVNAYAEDVRQMGGEIRTGFEVAKTERSSARDDRGEELIRLTSASSSEVVTCRKLITCAGLFSDRVSRQCEGTLREPSIVPFRGTWLTLKREFREMITTNIYPVPDPAFPWLGVHLTPTLDGEVLLGPNAVLAAKREGYDRSAFSARDALDALKHRGLRRMAWQHLHFGAREMWRDVNVRAYVDALRKYVPSLETSMIEGRYAGVRALAMDESDGMIDDFCFEAVGRNVLHIRNAPSPAATASLAIGSGVVDKAAELWDWEGGEQERAV